MYFALDESGSFKVETAPRPAVSTAVAVVVPQDELAPLMSMYRAFRKTLRPAELVDGEPKGRRLRLTSKVRFCSMLEHLRRVQVCPCIADLGHFPLKTVESLRNALASDICSIAQRSVDRVDMERLSDEIAGLHPVQSVRLYVWEYALVWALQQAILIPDIGTSLTEWDNRQVVIDPVQTNSASVEERVLLEMLPIRMVGWSLVRPFRVFDSSEEPYNSFREHFFEKDTIDFDAVLTGRVRFDHFAQANELLQIADIAANIVYRAARRPEVESEDMSLYRRLMRSCPYCPYASGLGIGLVTPHEQLAGPGTPHRFGRLFRAMVEAYELRRRVFAG